MSSPRLPFLLAITPRLALMVTPRPRGTHVPTVAGLQLMVAASCRRAVVTDQIVYFGVDHVDDRPREHGRVVALELAPRSGHAEHTNGKVCYTETSEAKGGTQMNEPAPIIVNGKVPSAGRPLSLVLSSAPVRLGQRCQAVFVLGLH